ncbi:MAG TPA: hypothetical protein DD422_09170 [Akkermansia sp.]|nr:hypothetical protein [Akkermansia sp.]HBN18209.1 hypothetical protein [Akkermansia sp.]
MKGSLETAFSLAGHRPCLFFDRKMRTIMFHHSLNYRELAPGGVYQVTIPVCLDNVELEDRKQCSCELETRSYNQ